MHYFSSEKSNQEWMKNAVGSEISVKPMLKAVDRALAIKSK
jgi:hypothetical protein